MWTMRQVELNLTLFIMELTNLGLLSKTFSAWTDTGQFIGVRIKTSTISFLYFGQGYLTNKSCFHASNIG